MPPIKTKETKVANPDIKGVTLAFERSIKLLYRDIPIENPSANKLARPNTSAYLGEISAPNIPAMIATVVITPSIPP